MYGTSKFHTHCFKALALFVPFDLHVGIAFVGLLYLSFITTNNSLSKLVFNNLSGPLYEHPYQYILLTSQGMAI